MQHVRAGLDSIAAQLLRNLPETERVLAAWPHVCGRMVADRTHALRYAEGTLTIEVEGREWGQLSGLTGQYLARLRQMTGVNVQHLSFEVPRTRP